MPDGKTKRIGIIRAHLEEDAGLLFPIFTPNAESAKPSLNYLPPSIDTLNTIRYCNLATLSVSV